MTRHPYDAAFRLRCELLLQRGVSRSLAAEVFRTRDSEALAILETARADEIPLFNDAWQDQQASDGDGAEPERRDPPP